MEPSHAPAVHAGERREVVARVDDGDVHGHPISSAFCLAEVTTACTWLSVTPSAYPFLL